jgi:hypothetical protein
MDGDTDAIHSYNHNVDSPISIKIVMMGESTIIGLPHRLSVIGITPLSGWVMAPPNNLIKQVD